MNPPLHFLFWAFVAAYVVHILEESLLPEVFVDKVRKYYFSFYSWHKFFGFNTFLLLVNIVAVILYENIGGNWIIFPLAMAVERVLNGFWHLVEMLITKKYSSGVLASVITWILFYLVVRYYVFEEIVTPTQFFTGLVIGTVIELLMLSILFLTRAWYRSHSIKAGLSS